LVAQKGAPASLLGPAPTGIIGGLFFMLFALVLLLKPGALEPAKRIGARSPSFCPRMLPQTRQNRNKNSKGLPFLAGGFFQGIYFTFL
jgi:hypothetical protein